MYLNFFITSTIALVAYPALAWGCNRYVTGYGVNGTSTHKPLSLFMSSKQLVTAILKPDAFMPRRLLGSPNFSLSFLFLGLRHVGGSSTLRQIGDATQYFKTIF